MLTKRTPPPPPGNFRLLPIGNAGFAIVDPDVYEWATLQYWRALKSHGNAYPARRTINAGKTQTIRLHIEISQPQPGQEVHHRDLYTFNCLKSNLENLSPSEHRQRHGKAF